MVRIARDLNARVVDDEEHHYVDEKEWEFDPVRRPKNVETPAQSNSEPRKGFIGWVRRHFIDLKDF